MAIEKIMGSETELGITARTASGFDPVGSAIFLINAMPEEASSRALWDYTGENPLLDARGYEATGERERPTAQDNRAHQQGAGERRAPLRGRRPPRVLHPRDAPTPGIWCCSRRPASGWPTPCREAANRTLPPHQQLVLYKNNSDGKGNSYGYHENYLVARSVPFERLVEALTPFLVSRIVFAGAGKVGAENGAEPCAYQISQRADFFETLIGLDTMAKRPIINTRDEPHADEERYRRLHVIVGDSNLAEVSTYLKVGTTALVLAMVEDGALRKDLALEDPVRAIKEISHDTTCTPEGPPEAGEGGLGGRAPAGVPGAGAGLLRHGRAVPPGHRPPGALGAGPDPARRGPPPVRPGAGLGHQAGAPRGLHQPEGDRVRRPARQHAGSAVPRSAHGQGAVLPVGAGGNGGAAAHRRGDPPGHAACPPPTPGPISGGRACGSSRAQVCGASWTSILLDTGDAAVKRIPMAEPARGTRKLVGEILERVGQRDGSLGATGRVGQRHLATRQLGDWAIRLVRETGRDRFVRVAKLPNRQVAQLPVLNEGGARPVDVHFSRHDAGSSFFDLVREREPDLLPRFARRGGRPAKECRGCRWARPFWR